MANGTSVLTGFNVIIRPSPIYVALGGTGSGGDSTPMGLAAFTTALTNCAHGQKFFLQGDDFKTTATLSIARPGVEIYGSGSTDQAAYATRIMGSVTTTGFTGAGPYTVALATEPKAVWMDDATAYAATANGRAQLVTRNTGTPTTPGAGEWGWSAGTLYLGSNPSGRTVEVVPSTSTHSIFTLAPGADDIFISGLEVGYVAGHGIYAPALQGAGQLSACNLGLYTVSAYGCYNQLLAAGALANSGIVIHLPMKVEGRALSLEYCDNDGLNLKQAGFGNIDGLFIRNCGDDGIGTHYGSSLKVRNFLIDTCAIVASSDGNGVTVFGGGEVSLEQGSILNPGNNGVFLTGVSTNYVPAIGHMTDVTLSNTAPGVGVGLNGVEGIGRFMLSANRVHSNFWQNTTSGKGFGFRFDDGSLAAGNGFATLKDCYSVRCRAGISTAKGGGGTMKVQVSNIILDDHSVANTSESGVTKSGTTTVVTLSIGGTQEPTPQSFYIS